MRAILLIFALISIQYMKVFEAKLEPLVASESYTHMLTPGGNAAPKQYQIFWKLLNNDDIQFEVHCNTTGWVGFGLSPNGLMTGNLNV